MKSPGFLLLSLPALLAGCGAPGDLLDGGPSAEERVPLDLWEPGWTLAYRSSQGHWQNFTVLGQERHEGWDVYRVQHNRSHLEASESDGVLLLDTVTLGQVWTSYRVESEFGCPIVRVLPLSDLTYSCRVKAAGSSFGNVTIDHRVASPSTVDLPFGSFAETIVEETADPPFEYASRRGYSAEVGYLTRFWDPATKEGMTEEFVLTSLSASKQ